MNIRYVIRGSWRIYIPTHTHTHIYIYIAMAIFRSRVKEEKLLKQRALSSFSIVIVSSVWEWVN